jgi:hypothetical protein
MQNSVVGQGHGSDEPNENGMRQTQDRTIHPAQTTFFRLDLTAQCVSRVPQSMLENDGIHLIVNGIFSQHAWVSRT